MDSVERVIAICKERGIAISRLEKDCGFGNGYIRGLREGKFPANRLYKIADYLNVPADYLLTGELPTLYHFDPETARIAQDIFDNPDLHFLFKSARTTSSKNIKILSELLETLEKTEAGDNNDPA